MADKRKIILDCDPGHDDAVNIIMAGRHPDFELLGITTVAGNETIEHVTRNALIMCQCLDIDVPVCMGMRKAMIRDEYPVAIPKQVMLHGETGLDGPVFPELTKQLDPRHAVDFIIESVLNADSPVTLLPTGPLSNIAMAIRKEPAILDNIQEIALMGGVYQHGNVTPAAEFNIFADAEAAYVVFNCGRPVVMFGLDVTRKVLCYPEIVERMAKVGNKASDLFADLMRYFCMKQKMVFGWEGGPLHDPCTMAYLIDPSCFKIEQMHVDIDISGSVSHGRTNCDTFHLTDKVKNAGVAVDVDAAKFWDVIEKCLTYYN